MTLPASAVDLDLVVAAGRAWIDGYLVRFPAAETVAITASSTVYLWLQLTGAGDSPPAVTATAWVETATLTNPGNAALVGEITTSGSAITGTDDENRREGAGYIIGKYTGDGSGGSQVIDIGATPRAVTITTRADLSTVYSEDAEIWVGNATLPTHETASNVVIIKDGFRVYDDDPSSGLNDNGQIYTYIAHF
jgi:hypothetical protein